MPDRQVVFGGTVFRTCQPERCLGAHGRIDVEQATFERPQVAVLGECLQGRDPHVRALVFEEPFGERDPVFAGRLADHVEGSDQYLGRLVVEDERRDHLLLLIGFEQVDSRQRAVGVATRQRFDDDGHRFDVEVERTPHRIDTVTMQGSSEQVEVRAMQASREQEPGRRQPRDQGRENVWPVEIEAREGQQAAGDRRLSAPYDHRVDERFAAGLDVVGQRHPQQLARNAVQAVAQRSVGALDQHHR